MGFFLKNGVGAFICDPGSQCVRGPRSTLVGLTPVPPRSCHASLCHAMPCHAMPYHHTNATLMPCLASISKTNGTKSAEESRVEPLPTVLCRGEIHLPQKKKADKSETSSSWPKTNPRKKNQIKIGGWIHKKIYSNKLNQKNFINTYTHNSTSSSAEKRSTTSLQRRH